MEEKQLCYVVMPFSGTSTLDELGWKSVFDKIFKHTFEVLGLECIRSEVRAGSILQNVISNIHRADIVLADLTDNKPNVLYELGIAHSITKKVVMVTQRINEVPSDLKPYGIVTYKADPSNEEMRRFQKDIMEARKKVYDLRTQSSPVFQILGENLHTLEGIIRNPIAIMECLNCHLQYEVAINETISSDSRAPPEIIQDHSNRGLCNHWECSQFVGVKQVA